MAQRKLTAAEVLALLDADEELDDPDEVMAEGSDEEFSDFEELEDLQKENEIGCESMDIGNGNKNTIKLCLTFTYSCLHIDIEANPSIFIPAAETIPSSPENSTTESLRISITLPSSHHLLSTTSSPTTPWTTQLKKPNIHEFCPKSPTGPSLPIPDSPLEIFHLFYTVELLDFIPIKPTNMPNKKFLLKCFLSLSLLLGQT